MTLRGTTDDNSGTFSRENRDGAGAHQMKLQRKGVLVILLLLLAGFAFRTWLILTLPGQYDGDPHRQDGYVYDTLAWNLVQGRGFDLNHTSAWVLGQCPPCDPTPLRTPGYPLFVATFFVLFGHLYLPVYF